MLEGRLEEQWWHTASLLCQTANVHRNEEERSIPYQPSEFHPLHWHEPIQLVQEELPAMSIDDVIGVFGGLSK